MLQAKDLQKVSQSLRSEKPTDVQLLDCEMARVYCEILKQLNNFSVFAMVSTEMSTTDAVREQLLNNGFTVQTDPFDSQCLVVSWSKPDEID